MIDNKFQKQKIGQILQQANLVSPAQVEMALLDQERYINLHLADFKLGEVLALRGWIKQETVDFFVERWHQFISQSETKRIGFYLHQAGLLNKEQIAWIVKQQNQLTIPPKFGEIACQQGWLKPKTVDFFLEHLYQQQESQLTSIDLSPLSIKEVLSRYMRGNRNLRNAQIDCVDFSYIVLEQADFAFSQIRKSYLKNTILNEANLEKADLSQSNLCQASLSKANLSSAILEKCNLSKTSLIQANLTGANLTGANLTGANLESACFKNAVLSGADLRGANCSGTLFQEAIYDRNTRFDADLNPQKLGMELIEDYQISTLQSYERSQESPTIKNQVYQRETFILF
ncbi:MAG: hypothetical protein Tsb0014_39840 [Pleurocapsa sp.]